MEKKKKVEGLAEPIFERMAEAEARPKAIADAEKLALKEALLTALDEPDPQLWAQLELLIAIIGDSVARARALEKARARAPSLHPAALDASEHAPARRCSRSARSTAT